MFEDSLIEARIKTRRGPATLVSFALEAILIGIVVLIPLLFTEALPAKQFVTELTAPPPPPPPPPPAAARATPVHREEPVPVKSELSMPMKIPQKIAMVKEAPATGAAAAPPSTVAGVVGGVPGGVAGGTLGGVVGGVLNSVGTALPAAPKRVRVTSGVTEGLLIHKVMPEYPAQAKTAHMQGTVVLAAVIGKDGVVKDVKVVSGPPMLAQSAMAAVKQWRYKPYVLNGQPTEVDTTINVNFKLGAAS
jgi:periplasmic protein TonB